MHDRRVNGEPLTFGIQGALYMRAMTWWDHKTESIWSQPLGTALEGPLEGTELTLIPASIIPWETWLDTHPETTVVVDSLRPLGFEAVREFDGFVIGVTLGDSAAAYRYADAAKRRVINDQVGELPVAVFVDPSSRDIKVYLRRVAIEDSGVSVLTFDIDDEGRIIDTETGSVWDTARGVARSGPLRRTPLQQLPYVSAYEWAWKDFYPHSTFYEG